MKQIFSSFLAIALLSVSFPGASLAQTERPIGPPGSGVLAPTLTPREQSTRNILNSIPTMVLTAGGTLNMLRDIASLLASPGISAIERADLLSIQAELIRRQGDLPVGSPQAPIVSAAPTAPNADRVASDQSAYQQSMRGCAAEPATRFATCGALINGTLASINRQLVDTNLSPESRSALERFRAAVLADREAERQLEVNNINLQINRYIERFRTGSQSSANDEQLRNDFAGLRARLDSLESDPNLSPANQALIAAARQRMDTAVEANDSFLRRWYQDLQTPQGIATNAIVAGFVVPPTVRGGRYVLRTAAEYARGVTAARRAARSIPVPRRITGPVRVTLPASGAAPVSTARTVLTGGRAIAGGLIVAVMDYTLCSLVDTRCQQWMTAIDQSGLDATYDDAVARRSRLMAALVILESLENMHFDSEEEYQAAFRAALPTGYSSLDAIRRAIADNTAIIDRAIADARALYPSTTPAPAPRPSTPPSSSGSTMNGPRSGTR